MFLRDKELSRTKLLSFLFFSVSAPKAICGVEKLRKALNVSCRVAIIIAVVIGKNWSKIIIEHVIALLLCDATRQANNR